MKKFAVFSLGVLFAGILLTACQHPAVVHASGETDYKPRPALRQYADEADAMNGELLRVNLAGKTIAVRVESGMVQTFKMDHDTMVT